MSCVGLLTSCSGRIDPPILATVLSLRGEVTCFAEGQRESHPVKADSRLAVRSVLRTSDGARLNLALLPGALVQVSSNSKFKIEELRRTKNGNDTSDEMLSRKVRLRLDRGAIGVLFESWDVNAAELKVITPHALIFAEESCLFQMQASDFKTRLTCVRGRVRVSQGNQGISVIDEGQVREWPSMRTETMSTASDSLKRIEISNALETEQELQRLASQQRPFLPY
jgi:hypothetical protein